MNRPTAWLELDQGHQRNTGRIRLLAALVTAAAAVWLRLAVSGAWVWAVVGASALACIFWVRSFAKLEAGISPDAIFADARGFYRRDAHDEVFLPWADIGSVILDEERGAIVIFRVGAESLILQNKYGKMGLEALYAWIEHRRGRCHNGEDRHGKI